MSDKGKRSINTQQLKIGVSNVEVSVHERRRSAGISQKNRDISRELQQEKDKVATTSTIPSETPRIHEEAAMSPQTFQFMRLGY